MLKIQSIWKQDLDKHGDGYRRWELKKRGCEGTKPVLLDILTF